MIKKIIGIVFFVIVLVCSTISVSAKVEFVNCCILQIGINQSGFEQNLMIKIADENGIETIYNCASRVRVNGRNYKYAEDVANLIPDNSFAKIAVDDDFVTVINFDTEQHNYENVKYNSKKKAFNVLNANNSGLPVYYRYNDNIVPSHLDENHVYDISVYKYGILITDMKSQNHESVLKYIELGSVINSDFLQNITVYCETDSNDDLILKGEIYDNKSNMLGRSQIRCNGDAEFGFNGLDNNENEYTLKLWLEDNEGNKKSSTYIKQYSTKKVEVKSGYILESAISSSAFEQNVLIRCSDENGIINTYTMAERVRINGRMYKDIYDISDCIYTDVFCKMAIEDGYVTALNFGTDCNNFYDVNYNPSDKVFEIPDENEYMLPVYYMYNDNFVPSHLDENHIYDISVYEYGVLITDMKSKNDESVLKLIELGSVINSDFLQNITVYCETDSNDDLILKGEIYDNKSNMLGRSQIRCNGDAEFGFNGFDNNENEYTLKLWLEDNEGNKKSSTYIKQYTTKKVEVKSGYILESAISSSEFEQNVLIRCADQNGIISTYTCAERVRINGRLYKNNEDIINNISCDVFAKFAIENGYITVMSYGSDFIRYENAKYNLSQNCFEDISESQNNLPVYYQYGEDFAPAYLDENHLYDITVFDSGILITDIKSKNNLEVIKLIEQDCAVNSQFNQYINVYCETTVEDRCILKGEVYDEKSKRIYTGETLCNGDADLDLNINKNKFKADKIKLWLEDMNGQIISSVYTLNAKVQQSKIVYGDVVMTYTLSLDDGEQLVMSVKDVNGNDKVYQCDNDIIVVNDAVLMSLNNAGTNISENQFIKMAVEDNVVKVIKIGIDTLEISADDFVYEESLNGNVCVINNTENSTDLTCYTAVFDKDGILKDISIDKTFAQTGENVHIYPQFDKYNNYTQGDYIKVFVWDSLNITPVLSGVKSEIIIK